MAPTRRLAVSIRDGWSRMSSARVSATSPWPSAPVRSLIWLRTMLAATPVRKPSMTERETKRV